MSSIIISSRGAVARSAIGIIRRRPFSTLAATSTVTVIGYSNYIEWRANNNSISNNHQPNIETIIPRDLYDGHAIASYWEQRPVSVVRRLLDIVCQIGPVAAEYVFSFHCLPWWNSVIESGNKDSSNSSNNGSNSQEEELAVEFQQQKRQMEIDLSQKLRAALTHLGPTFIKVGQQLSIRPDLVSPTVLFELQRLCDAVPPFDDKIAMKVLAQELLNTDATATNNSDNTEEEEVNNIVMSVFEEMPRLVASASLGQVYKGTLRSNASSQSKEQQVAIKIQRPDILETVTLDLFLLLSYGKVVDKLCSIFTNQIPYHENFLNSFANGAFMELNYIAEATNQIYFRKELHSRFNSEASTMKKKMTKVIIPNVHEEYTTHRVLVSEWIEGIPLAQAPEQQIQQLIPIGVELFLCQLLDIGKFHSG